MKTFWSLMGVGTVGLFAVCDLCQPAAIAITAAPARARHLASVPDPANQRTVVLKIEGMTGGGCAIATRKLLARLTGVSKVEVSYEQGRAVVTYDSTKITVEEMIAAVKTLGYTATALEGRRLVAIIRVHDERSAHGVAAAVASRMRPNAERRTVAHSQW